jgi:DNA-binding NarL/FixJ family response regulator
MSVIRILLADDHAVLRAGLTALAQRPHLIWTVVGEAADGGELLTLVAANRAGHHSA